MINQLSLNPNLLESVQEVAHEQGQSVESVLNELMQQYLQQTEEAKIDRESKHFENMHPKLKQKYFGEYVVIHNGRLVDHDHDPDALASRIREKYGHMAVLVAFIEDEPFPTYTVRSPRLIHSK